MVRQKNVIAIMSPKGGVGKTVTTANLAAALASHHDKKILAIDTNVSTASLGLHLDLFYPKTTLHDVLRKKSARDAIHVYHDNLHLIPASIKVKKAEKDPKKARENIGRLVNQYDSLLKDLSDEYDLILLDCAPGFDVESVATMHVAGGLILVTNPEYPALVTAAKAVEHAKHLKMPVGGVVLNKVGKKKYELTQDEIEEALKLKVIEKIPFDKKVPESIAYRVPVTLFKPRSKAGKAYKKLAASLIGEEPKKRRFMRFNMKKKK